MRRTRSDTSAKRYIDPANLAGVVEGVNALDLRLGDVVLVEAGEIIPGDGDILEGVASVNEFGDHRRVRAGHPRGRRRPLGRHRRHDRAVRLHQGEDHRRAGFDLHRPDDRAGRRRRAAEDAERTGALDSALRADHHLPDRLRHLVADRQVFRDRPVGDRPDRAARLSHSDHDRRPSVGHRHRRHGPAGPLQRHRDLRPRGRGGGRRRHAAARQDRHDHVRQSHGDRASCRCDGVSTQDLAAAALASSLADETPEGRSIVALAKGDFGLVEPKFDTAETTVVPFSAQTRISGVDVGGRSIRKGAIDSILRYLKLPIERTPLEFRQAVERVALSGGTPLGGRRRRHAAGRHPPEGRREARHQGALRRDARDGHPHRHGDRRQSGHRRGDRFRSGRRRLSRRGDARGQARLHPQGAGRRPADRHVRRRHQRRAGARPGRCRRRDADRHPGGARSRQHGRSRLQSDQAHRDRRDRQAAPDDARLAHHLLDRQ